MAHSYVEPGARDVRSSGSFLWWLIRSQASRVVAAAALGTVWMVGLALPPYLIGRAIDEGIRTHDQERLVIWSGALLAVGAVNAVVAILRHRTLTKVRMDAAFRTSHAVVLRSTRLGAALSRGVNVGEVISIGVTDVWTISTSLTFVGPGVGAVVTYLVVAGLLYSISPPLAVVIMIGAPVTAIIVGPVIGRLRLAGTEYRIRQGELSADLVDIVDGLRVLNGIGGKDLYRARYARRSSQLLAEGYKVGAVASWVPAFATCMPVLFLAVVSWLGARMTAEGSMSIGDLVAVYGFAAVLVVPVNQVIQDGAKLVQALIASRRVIALWSIPDPPLGSDAATCPDARGDLCDPESGIRVPGGSFVGIVSERSGDALGVIDRLGSFTPSVATWDGHLLADLDPHDAHRRILVADNSASLFSGSIRDVLRGSGAADDLAIGRALHVAAAEDIVDALADGLSTWTMEQARDLSGGQRQRLRLARALLAEPDVLLAVEPTSAVDAHTEAVIARRLRTERAGRTTVVLTSSPILLHETDAVIFLVDGRVCDVGGHLELITRQRAYRELLARDVGETVGPRRSTPTRPQSTERVP